jgi:putative intracellular protease/amidase
MVPCTYYPTIAIICRTRLTKIKPEFAHPWEVLHEKTELTIASPKGGEAPLDPSSVQMFASDPVSSKFLKEQESLWKNTEKLADFLPRVSEFDAIFYVGGHGRKGFLVSH